MRNLLLRLSYQGKPFYGWQKQPDRMTVQGLLERSLLRITGERIQVIGAGRTDRGVHALGQACNLHLQSEIPATQLQRALNALLPPEVRVWSFMEVELSFHARRDVLSKSYLQVLWNGSMMNPFLLGRAVHEPLPFDWDRVSEATSLLVGEHDFRAFAKAGSTLGGTVRRITRAEWLGRPPLLGLLLEGNGFLQHMVRCLTGTLLEIGHGRMEPSTIKKLLTGAERSQAGPTISSEGLYLVSVSYPGKEIPNPPWDFPFPLPGLAAGECRAKDG